MNPLFLERLGAPVWLWLAFAALVVALLAFDLGVQEKRDKAMSLRASLVLSAIYISVGLAFGAVVAWRLGMEAGVNYLTGFVIEKMLSLDNIFIIAMILQKFSTPPADQRRVLFWGVAFAVVLRAALVALGAALIAKFSWILYLFSAFLVVVGAKTLLLPGKKQPAGESSVVRFLRARFNIAEERHGKRFFVRLEHPKTGKRALFVTPLFVALVLVELADVIFAIDSVPAIFAITREPFIVFTSNIFAILGLRALYFALSAAVTRFRYLEPTLAVVLIFIGSKIFVADAIGEEIPASVSLGVTVTIIAAGGLLSLWRGADAKAEQRRGEKPAPVEKRKKAAAKKR